MQKLKKLFLLVGALLALALVSCGSDSDDGSETATQQKSAGSISYATTSVEKTTTAKAFTNELTKTGDGTVTYASSKTDVATVNATTGEVTIAGAGETTITATVADSDSYTYATKTASYTLTVTLASPLNLNLKTGGAIHSILVQLCAGSGTDSSACTKFARSETNNEKATLYLDTEEKYIPVWSVDTEVYYYVPDGCMPVMNEDSSGMFAYCYKLTSLEVTGFDTSDVTNMSRMFDGCSELTSLDVSKFDTSKVENMSGMFNYCYALTSLDVTGFDTSNVTNMESMFGGCSGLNSLDVSKFDTSNVTDMSSMFNCCSGLASLDVTGFDTSKVTNMTYMFVGCSGLASLDLSNFDTSKVSNMRGMFFRCYGLTNLDVTGFDTSNVTNMESMFASCSELTGLDLSKFVTSKVTNMSEMFYYCSKLTSLDVSKFCTSNVTNMSNMFSGCSGLKSLDVTGFDTSKVTNMTYMFDNCSGLTSLDLSNFDTSKVSNMCGMFYECSELITIYASDKFVTTSIPNGDIGCTYQCFYLCSKLVGGAGTTFGATNEQQTLAVPYARIDGGTDSPGYFTLKLIGSKSKPDAVGDIVFSDGSATAYTADLTLTEEQKSKAVAVIFYVGTECSNDSTSRTLGVGLAQNQSGLAWCLESAAAHDKNITTIQESDKDGSDNLSQIGEFLNGNNDTGTADNYPAFYFAKNYSGTATNLGETYADGWYLPSIAELQKIYDILTTVNNALDACDGTTFATSGAYWSSSQYASSDDKAYDFSFYFKDWRNLSKDFSYTFVCAVRAF